MSPAIFQGSIATSEPRPTHSPAARHTEVTDATNVRNRVCNCDRSGVTATASLSLQSVAMLFGNGANVRGSLPPAACTVPLRRAHREESSRHPRRGGLAPGRGHGLSCLPPRLLVEQPSRVRCSRERRASARRQPRQIWILPSAASPRAAIESPERPCRERH
jgi:hypothetical protein